MVPELTTYIKNAGEHGLSEIEIKQNLLNAGWQAGEVEEAFIHLKAEENQLPSNQDEDIKPRHQINLSENLQSPATSPSIKKQQEVRLQKSIQESPTIYEKPVGKNSVAKKVIYSALLLMGLGLVGGGAYAYIFIWQGNPEAIWKNAMLMEKNQVFSSSYNLEYSDQGEVTEPTLVPFELEDVKFSMEGDLYLDSRDKKNPQSSNTFKYTASSGSNSVSTGFAYKLINRVLYINVGDNPILRSIFFTVEPKVEETSDWVRLDLNALNESLNSKSSPEAPSLEGIFSEQFKSDLNNIWEKQNFIKMESVLGRESIGKTRTIHFKNSLDKNTLAESVNKTVDLFNSAMKPTNNALEEKEVDLIKKTFGDLIGKLNVSKFETWVGIKDLRLYKITFESNALSIISAINSATKGSSAANRDAKRLADIIKLMRALEIYYNDKGSYPLGSEGKAAGLASAYMDTLPTAPTPPDGVCNEYFNEYWYEPKETYKDTSGNTLARNFEITFCLGNEVGGYNAGIAKATMSGIDSNINCPSSPENCPSKKPEEIQMVLLTEEERIQKFIGDIQYSAVLKINASYSDYGLVKDLKAPEKSFDLSEMLKNQVKGVFTTH